jgi:general secretion pathway protein B
MSFILDALKKSELERQRQTVPGLMDPGAAAPRSRLPLWAAAIGILLAVNLIVLSVVLVRREAAPAPAAAPVTAVAPATTAAVPVATSAAPASSADPAGADHFSPMDVAPGTYAPEIPLAEGSAATDHAADHAAARPTEPALRAAESPNSGSARVDEEADEVLPSIDQVNLTGAEALPELHLDVHVYATSARDRFVYINGHKYREGMRLAEGPVLERIRRDGVVLNAGGIRFVLPRQ